MSAMILGRGFCEEVNITDHNDNYTGSLLD